MRHYSTATPLRLLVLYVVARRRVRAGECHNGERLTVLRARVCALTNVDPVLIHQTMLTYILLVGMGGFLAQLCTHL